MVSGAHPTRKKKKKEVTHKEWKTNAWSYEERL